MLKKYRYFEFFEYNTNFTNLILNKFTNLFCTNINCYLPNDQYDKYYNFMNSIFPNKLECEI